MTRLAILGCLLGASIVVTRTDTGSRFPENRLPVSVVSAPQAPATGTARIAGVVVSADADARPIRRAIVKLSGGGDPGRSAVTDDQGRFEIDGLAAGRVMLTGSVRGSP